MRFPVSVNKRIAASEGPNLWAPELTNRALTTREVEKIVESLEYMERVLNWKPNITLKMRSMVTGMDEHSVTIHTTDVGDSTLEADTVVMAVGLRSENQLYEALKSKLGDRIHLVGDAEQIGTVMAAVHTADRVAKAL